MNKAMIIVTIGFAAGLASGAGVALATTAGAKAEISTFINTEAAPSIASEAASDLAAAGISPQAGQPFGLAGLTAEKLVGEPVRDETGVWVGEVSAVETVADAPTASLIVDVGGFLGIWERPVAVSTDRIWVSIDGDGEVSEVIVAYSEAELEAMPEAEM